MTLSNKQLGVGGGLFALCLLSQCPEDSARPSTERTSESTDTSSNEQDSDLNQLRLGLGLILRAAREMDEEPFTVTETYESPAETVRNCIESTGEFSCLETNYSRKDTYCFFTGAYEDDQYPVYFFGGYSHFILRDSSEDQDNNLEVELLPDSQEPEDVQRHLTEVCRAVVEAIQTDVPKEEVTPFNMAVRASWGQRVDAYLNAVEDFESMGWPLEDLGGQKVKVEMPNGDHLFIAPDLDMERSEEEGVITFHPEPNFFIENLENRSQWMNLYSGEEGPALWIEEQYGKRWGDIP